MLGLKRLLIMAYNCYPVIWKTYLEHGFRTFSRISLTSFLLDSGLERPGPNWDSRRTVIRLEHLEGGTRDWPLQSKR